MIKENGSESSVVLLSGGQDSATCLALALKKGPVLGLCFDYGQRHRVEIEQAGVLAEVAKVPLTVLKLPLLSELTVNSLTRHDQAIEQVEGELPNTFVDGRNLLFLTYAAIFAKSKGMSIIYTGVCQTDYSGYPDCRDDFIRSLNQTLNLAMDYTFELRTPLMWLSKGETVLKMKHMGRLDWYAHTHTCYEGLRPACGRCPACVLRLHGFEMAGAVDPLAYAD